MSVTPDTAANLNASGPALAPLAGLESAYFIAGPTAVGKSQVALCLAERLHGEIVSVDSMQVYRGMDVGTAKPTAAERARVPHHLLDILEISASFDTAQFVALAGRAAKEITGRGRVPIFCGGTGLYFKALLHGLRTAPAADPVLRQQLKSTPLSDLLRELSAKDAVTYERIDRQNPRRVIRALEVIRLTGKPFSEQRATWSVLEKPPYGGRFFVISREPGDLHRRIEARVDAMFRLGLVEETRRLLQAGLAQNEIAMQALGYRQVADYLRGGTTLEETIQLVKIRTRQFAKRQLTWFRRQVRATWLPVAEQESPEHTVSRIRSCAEPGAH